MSNSLQSRGLQPARLLCPWGFYRQEYWNVLPCTLPGDLPDPGIEPRSPTLQADSLPSEPPRKPKNTGVGSLSLLQGNFPIQESNQGLPHCRWILYQVSYLGSPEHGHRKGLIFLYFFGVHITPYKHDAHMFAVSSLWQVHSFPSLPQIPKSGSGQRLPKKASKQSAKNAVCT